MSREGASMLGRISELKLLEDLYSKKEMQVVFLQGEKDIGKTILLNEFLKNKVRAYFCVRNSTNNINKASFSTELAAQGFSDLRDVTWNQTLDNIIKKSIGEKVILAIDNADLLKGSFNELLDALTENMRKLKDKIRLYVVFVGEDLLYVKKVLSEFNQHSTVITLKRLSYQEVIPNLENMENEEKIIMYGVSGGYPEYFKFIDYTRSLKDNLLKLFFSVDSVFLNLGETVLSTKVREPYYYHAILCSVSCGSLRMKDIAEAVGESDSKVSKYINVLVRMGILKKITPLQDGESKSSRNAFYLMNNKTLEFWYAYVFPFLSNIKLGRGNQVLRENVLPRLTGYAYKTFLEICYQHCFVLKERNNFYVDFDSLDYDFDKNGTLDSMRLVAKTSKEICFVKCYWKNNRMDYDEILEFVNMFSEENRRCFYVIFSRKGFTERALATEANKDNIRLISLRYLK